MLDPDSEVLVDEWDGYDIDADGNEDDEEQDDEETEEGREKSDDAEVLALEREINKTYKVSTEQLAVGKSALSKVRATLVL